MKKNNYLSRSLALSFFIHTLVFCGVFGAHKLFGAQTNSNSKLINVNLNPSRFNTNAQIEKNFKSEKISLNEPEEKLLKTLPLNDLKLSRKSVERVKMPKQISKATSTESSKKDISQTNNSVNSISSQNSAPSAKALILYAPKPAYPWLARKAGFEGQVLLGVTLQASGALEQVRVVQSSGRDDCDQSALSTVKNDWKFRAPGEVGLNAGEEVELLVVYRLR